MSNQLQRWRRRRSSIPCHQINQETIGLPATEMLAAAPVATGRGQVLRAASARSLARPYQAGTSNQLSPRTDSGGQIICILLPIYAATNRTPKWKNYERKFISFFYQSPQVPLAPERKPHWPGDRQRWWRRRRAASGAWHGVSDRSRMRARALAAQRSPSWYVCRSPDQSDQLQLEVQLQKSSEPQPNSEVVRSSDGRLVYGNWLVLGTALRRTSETRAWPDTRVTIRVRSIFQRNHK